MEGFLPVFCFILFLAALVGLTFYFFTRGLEVVTEGTVAVILRQGERNRILPPGRHFLIPFIDRVVKEIELREYDDTLHADRVMTKGATTIGLDMDVQYRIRRYVRRGMSNEAKARLSNKPVVFWNNNAEVIAWEDIFKAAFEFDDWHEKTLKEARAIMYDYFSTVDYRNEIFNGPGDALRRISSIITQKVNERSLKLGVEVLRINIYNLEIDQATRDFLTAERRAWQEGQLRALQARNEQSIRQILGMEDDNEAYLRWRHIESLKELYKNPNVQLNIGDDYNDERRRRLE